MIKSPVTVTCLYIYIYIYMPMYVLFLTSVNSKHDRASLHLIWILLLEPAQKSWPDDSCTVACFQTRSVWPKSDQSSQTKLDPGWFCTIWSRLSLEEWNQIRCGKLVVGQLQSARTGPNDSFTAACFWTRFIWVRSSRTKLDLGQF